MLEGLTTQQPNEVALACDSSEWIELLDAGVLPRNYAGVLARCEFARHKLGLLDDEVTFERIPDGINWAIPETSARPLQVEMTANTVHSVDQINVGGIGEWSSPFSGLARLYQLDVDPTIHVGASIRVTPLLRVGSTAHESNYDWSLYEAIKDRVLATAAPIGFVRDHSGSLDNAYLLHLHWPEWFGFDNLAEHERLRDELEDFAIPIVWTAHNLTPHDRRPDVYDPIYAMWAGTIDAVIHHSV
ncbi:MAG: hypothetical protein EXQ69_08410 [Acidimicrobiia bacterium]|nr:hypothetical protein [Acidimicrobiia bacterium]